MSGSMPAVSAVLTPSVFPGRRVLAGTRSNGVVHTAARRSYCYSSKSRSLSFSFHPTSIYPRAKPLSPITQWQDCTVKVEIDVPSSVAYNYLSNPESAPRWMVFISSVKILEDDRDVSRWSMNYKAFGHDLNFVWLARQLEPIPNQKIHWKSFEGFTSRGIVRLFPKGPSSCIVEVHFSYEVPQHLTLVASLLHPFIEGLLQNSLKRFSTIIEVDYGLNTNWCGLS